MKPCKTIADITQSYLGGSGAKEQLDLPAVAQSLWGKILLLLSSTLPFTTMGRKQMNTVM